jgi:hypothetical protein
VSVHAVLMQASREKRCVELRISGATRRICPHALGFKKGSPRVLAFQYEGTSISGLAPGGQWRAFFIAEIEAAALIDGGWRSGPSFIAKAEVCLDRIEYRVHF